MATRRDPFDPTDPANLQPEQRQHEVAAILAAGVIRMREKRRASPVGAISKAPGTGQSASPLGRALAVGHVVNCRPRLLGRQDYHA